MESITVMLHGVVLKNKQKEIWRKGFMGRAIDINSTTKSIGDIINVGDRLRSPFMLDQCSEQNVAVARSEFNSSLGGTCIHYDWPLDTVGFGIALEIFEAKILA